MKKTSHADQPKHHPHLPNWLKGVIVYLASFVALLAILYGVFSVLFAGKIYPRVAVAGVTVGGLTTEEARAKLEKGLADHQAQTVILRDDHGHSFTIKPEDVEARPDIAKSVEAAIAVGRDSNWLKSLSQKILSPLFGYDLPAAVMVNDQKLTDALKQITDELTVEEKNADLAIKNGVVSITPAVTGQHVEDKHLKAAVIAGLGQEKAETIELAVKQKGPAITEKDLTKAKTEAEAMLASSLTYTYKDQTYPASAATIGGWIQTKVVKAVFGTNLEVGLDEAKIESFLAEVASKIDQEAQDARLAVVNGQVNIIQSSKDGIKLKRDVAKAETIRLLTIRKEVPNTDLVTVSPAASTASSATPASTPAASPSPAATTNTIALETEIQKPDVTDTNINEIGIKERIAISVTDFKGSPTNRAENIRVGTRLFNGIILKPGQQFSAVKSLGRIDESAGFKPELVIKQDQLTPEVGGGLCQVSTTLFRAAMNAGLQIDERRNHRFRVSYYEAKPATPEPEDYVTNTAKTLVGMDATIYDPSPDFKFTNDTGSYMLIQGKVEGTRLTFELFGTKDGRKVTIDGPYITSTTPAPTDIQYIDDPTLPTGETKVKEKAVAGATTRFTYKVEKDGKVLHNDTFRSTYVAWQAKHYRGTGPVASPSPSPAVSPSPTAEASPVATPAP